MNKTFLFLAGMIIAASLSALANQAQRSQAIVDWDRGEAGIVKGVVCASDADCAEGRCRLLDTGPQLVFADDVRAAFVRPSNSQRFVAPPSGCDGECLPSTPKQSVWAQPLAVCDDHYDDVEFAEIDAEDEK